MAYVKRCEIVFNSVPILRSGPQTSGLPVPGFHKHLRSLPVCIPSNLRLPLLGSLFQATKGPKQQKINVMNRCQALHQTSQTLSMACLLSTLLSLSLSNNTPFCQKTVPSTLPIKWFQWPWLYFINIIYRLHTIPVKYHYNYFLMGLREIHSLTPNHTTNK